MSFVETGARRFAFKAHGYFKHYIACDLDEGVLRYWPSESSEVPYRLAFSDNKNERDAAYRIYEQMQENEYCAGVKLDESQINEMSFLLTRENIESMRGLDESAMSARSGGFCYRDGWKTDFYAEGDDGFPPLVLKDIMSFSFKGEELPFEKLESYVLTEILSYHWEVFLLDVSYKMSPDKCKTIVERALEVGLEAIEEVLWNGTSELLETLDSTPISTHLSYTLSNDSFTVKYGKSISKACKVSENPACVAVFGRKHVFSE